MKKLAAAQKREIAAIAAKTDATIDFSDMPEVLDWSGDWTVLPAVQAFRHHPARRRCH
jgi:hypothetical protein